MMYKVKNVVTKFFHPSFLFSSASEKRKRTPSTEDVQDDKREEENQDKRRPYSVSGNDETDNRQTSANPKSSLSRSKIRTTTSFQPNTVRFADEQLQLTDDEDSNDGNRLHTKELKQLYHPQTKRRRIITNGNMLTSTTSNSSKIPEITISQASSIFLDNGNKTMVSKERKYQTLTTAALTSQRQINSPIYDHSTLFSAVNNHALSPIGSPVKTSTSDSYASRNNQTLACNAVSRGFDNHLLSPNAKLFNTSYSSINSRRLPYIERLRRRALEDCVRLNRTLLDPPLSTPIVDQDLHITPKIEKEAGVPRGVQTENSTSDFNGTSSKHRAFPPVSIRNEITSIPTGKNITSQAQVSQPQFPSLSTNSTITIEPKIQSNNAKVMGDFTPFSWPKFIHAQEEFARQNSKLCQSEIEPIQSVQSKTTVHEPQTLPDTTKKLQPNGSTKVQSSTSVPTSARISSFKMPVPHEVGWKCPSCSMEHSTQTASCSFCHAINPKYKRLSVKSNDKPSVSVSSSMLQTQPDTISAQLDTRQSEANIVQTSSATSQPIDSSPKTAIETSNTAQSQSNAVTSSLSTTFSVPISATKLPNSVTSSSTASVSTGTFAQPISSGVTPPSLSEKLLQFGSSSNFNFNTNPSINLPVTTTSQLFQPSIINSSATTTVPSTSTGFHISGGIALPTTTQSVPPNISTASTTQSGSISTSLTQSTNSVLPVSTTIVSSVPSTTTTQNPSAQITTATTTTTFGQGFSLSPFSSFPSSLSSGFPVQTAKPSTTSTVANISSTTTPFLFGSSASSFVSPFSGFTNPSASFPTTTSQANVLTTTTIQSQPFQSIASTSLSPPNTVVSLSSTTIAQTPASSTSTFSTFGGIGSGTFSTFSTTIPSTKTSTSDILSTTATTAAPFLFGSTATSQSSEKESFPFGSSPSLFGFPATSSQTTTLQPFQPNISSSSTTTTTAAPIPGFAFNPSTNSNSSNGTQSSLATSTAFGIPTTLNFNFGGTAPSQPNGSPFHFGGQVPFSTSVSASVVNPGAQASSEGPNPFSATGNETPKRTFAKAKRRKPI
ncbi:unnamed protein product [Didymodactylos carnosus]|uniref:RanBP2-type domain-containing protein n=1 Tax=Didymodactylos carnosus TaxID=1234261 RepID=A0A8S2EFX8_9BILA|nr:unnamed protein product [Didymodactylos carnosus]CAF3962413.1 unnamed protein product [Didymodactylos carnosus]